MSKKHKGQTIKVGDVEYPVVQTFTVLYPGWASDNTGYVVKKGEKHALVLTSHGTPYLATQHHFMETLQIMEHAAQEARHAYAMAFLP